MINCFFAENLKIKRTFINKLIYIGPLFTFIMAILLAFNYYVVDSYNWWYMNILPCVIALECSLIWGIDNKYKNKAVLSLPVKLEKVWYAKVLVVLKNVLISNIVLFILTNIVSSVLNINNVLNIPLINGFAAIIILILTFMWQIPLWIFINQKLNKYICVILSVCINTIFQVLSVSLNLWFLIPFCYPARLMCPVLKILPNGLTAVPESITYKPELMNTTSIPYCIIVSLILFIMFSYLTGKVYSKIEAI